MKAMQAEAVAAIETSPLRMVERPDPRPAAGEVRLRVACCAICRTDLHVIEGDLPPRQRPIIPGHQIVGVVDEIGPGSGRLRTGQRVGVAWLRQTCGQCRFCRHASENLCESARFTGYDANGGYAEFACVPEEFAYEIPDQLSDAHAAPLLCAGIIGYRALKRADLRAGGRLALYGFGSSAHIVLQLALHRGCEVQVVTRGERHRALARQMGATWVGEPGRQPPAKADSAIIFAPAGDLVPVALESLDKGGTLALAGIYMTDVPVLNYEHHLFYERSVRSVTANTRDDGRDLLREAAAIPVRPHVTEYSLADANRALHDLKADRLQGTGLLRVGA